MKVRERAGVRCRGCGAVWWGANARFCGRCGQSLDAQQLADPHTGSSDDPGGYTRARTSLRSLTVLLGGVAVVLGAVLAARAAIPEIGTGAGRGDLSVELPQAHSTDGSRASHSAPQGASATRSQPVDCRPRGCELWRADLGPGDVLADEGLLVHAGPGALSAVDLASGRILWSSAPEPGLRTPRPLFLQRQPPLLAAAVSDRLEARDSATGRVLWIAPLPGRADAVVRRGGQLLVSGRAAGTDENAHGTRSNGFVAGIDPATGTTNWLQTHLGVLSLDAELPLVRFPADVMAGLDPASGDALWRLPLSPMGGEPAEFAHGGGWAIVSNGGGLTIIDVRTGLLQHQVAIDVSPPGWIDIVGSAGIIARPEQANGPPAHLHQDAPATVSIVNLDEPSAPIRTFGGVIDILVLEEHLTAAVPTEQASRGLVLAALDPGAFVMHRLDKAGEPLWRRHILREPDARFDVTPCCWSLERGTGQGSFLAVPPFGTSEPVRSIALDGRILTRFDRPSTHDRADGPRWSGWRPVILPGTSSSDPTIVAGPWTSIEVSGAATPIATDPLVLVTDTGLLAIDPAFLAGTP